MLSNRTKEAEKRGMEIFGMTLEEKSDLNVLWMHENGYDMIRRMRRLLRDRGYENRRSIGDTVEDFKRMINEAKEK